MSAGHDFEQQFRKIQRNSGKLKFHGRFHDCKWTDFKCIRELGNGSYGHVAKYQYQNYPMAVKTMTRTGDLEENKRILIDLDVTTKTGDCPHIVKCYGYFITQQIVRICMEVMVTCLENLKPKLPNCRFRQDILGKVVVSVLDALNYLKTKHKVIHRDVKPPNILMNYHGSIKLCDFGISGFLVESFVHTNQAGCLPYMAPERLFPQAYKAKYDVRSDVWSLGITIVELATGQFPYTAGDQPDKAFYGYSGNFACMSLIVTSDAPRLRAQDGFAPDLCDFVAHTLSKDLRTRPKYPELLEHRYIHRCRHEKTDVGNWLEIVMNAGEDSE